MKSALITFSMLITVGCGRVDSLIPGPTGATGLAGVGCTISQLPVNSSIAPNGGVLVLCGGDSSAILQNGLNGQPGTLIKPIQFCPGFTPSYPSSFPEYGFVIDGAVYGVYSDHGGFMALLPPGAYSSNGINASCTFTIDADGIIS